MIAVFVAVATATPAAAFGVVSRSYYASHDLDCQLTGQSSAGPPRAARTWRTSGAECPSLGVAYRYDFGIGEYKYAPNDVTRTGSSALNITGGAHRPAGYPAFTT